MIRIVLLLTLASFLPLGKAAAHEFWIDPLDHVVPSGGGLEAHLRVGTEFVGSAQIYLPRNFVRFEVLTGGNAIPVEGRLGDSPALSMTDLPDGLAIIVHQTTESRITWSEWGRFVAFVEHKDLGDIAAMQAARGLDQQDVREGFTRFAKSLVAVGDGAGADRRVGLRTEIVALANPFTDVLNGGLPVQVWLDDAPVPGIQVELFEMSADGDVVITLHHTDADGIAVLPVRPGHRYMADSVTLEPDEPDGERDPEWQSLWANLTFAVP